MSDTLIPLKCPRCGHEWRKDVKELENLGQDFYRGPDDKRKIVRYRARCPNDDTYVVVELVVVDDA